MDEMYVACLEYGQNRSFQLIQKEMKKKTTKKGTTEKENFVALYTN